MAFKVVFNAFEFPFQGIDNHICVGRPNAVRLGSEQANGAIRLNEAEGLIGGGIVASYQQRNDTFAGSEVRVIGLRRDGEGSMVPCSGIERGQLPVMGNQRI